MIGSSFLFAENPAGKAKMYLHTGINEQNATPCCYFSGEIFVVECLPQTFSGGLMVCAEAVRAVRYDSDFAWQTEPWPMQEYILSEKDKIAIKLSELRKF